MSRCVVFMNSFGTWNNNERHLHDKNSFVIYCGMPGPPCLKVYTCIGHRFMFMFMRVFKKSKCINSPPYITGSRVWLSGPSGASGFAGDPTSLPYDIIFVSLSVR